MARKNFKLEVNTDFDFFLFGISSSEPDYRLCWSINKSLGTNLIKANNHAFKSNESLHEFSAFQYKDPEACVNYYLIANHSETANLLDGLKNIDFLLTIEAQWNEETLNNIAAMLRATSGIQGLFKLDPKKFKSAIRLIN